jgi:hypothetical protein
MKKLWTFCNVCAVTFVLQKAALGGLMGCLRRVFILRFLCGKLARAKKRERPNATQPRLFASSDGPRPPRFCGRVKGKTPSDGEVREMPFLYLVKEDEIYIVDGGADMMAAAAYGNICH